MSNKKTKKALDKNTGAFKNLLRLLAVFSDGSHRLDEMLADINQELLQIVDDRLADYAQYQMAVTEAETALKGICLAHQEWFKTKQSMGTPFGKVAFRKSTTTEIPNEEVTILLLEQHAEKTPDFDITLYVQTHKTANKEALEKLPPELLERFRVKRTEKLNFSVSPAKIDMGKAVKESAEKVEKEAA